MSRSSVVLSLFVFILFTNATFSQPPLLPTLDAALDGKNIVLTWDDNSEKNTIDPTLQINDFEGYKLYRAYDIFFQTSEWINDLEGNPRFMKPIFECDKIDGIIGFAEFPQYGFNYYLGSDTGLKHEFVDSTYQQSDSLFYAIVAYDSGVDSLNIPPVENFIALELSMNGDILSVPKNIVIISPKTAVNTTNNNLSSFQLYQNSPNPFNPITKIGYELRSASFVTITIYNLLGEKIAIVVNEYQAQGFHSISWNASTYESGVYIYIMKAGMHTVTKKMLLLK